ncbi:MAG: DUF11 domain-containing protein [Caldilineaceae bacterium]|nr:DUF11 domain-containing protein [Caldilineaceae bacterium]
MLQIRQIAAGAALAAILLVGGIRALAAADSTEAGCPNPVAAVALSGPSASQRGIVQVFTAQAAPWGATPPITYTWSPPPETGQGTDTATYRWAAVGRYTVSVRAENCGGSATDSRTVQVYTTPAPDLAIGKTAPPVATAGERITYTLTVTNYGAAPAAGLLITDTLPAGAAYLEGGQLTGDPLTGDQVRWSVPSLPGAGSSVQVTYTVSAGTTLVNDDYAAAGGEIRARGAISVETLLVDDYVQIDRYIGGTLSSGASDSRIEITLGAASTEAPLTVALLRLAQPTHALPDTMVFASRAFRLAAIPARAGPLDGVTVVEMAYSSAKTESNLKLAYWDGRRWRTQGITCFRFPTAAAVTCTVALPALSEYVLFEPNGSRAYLPHLD